VCELQTALKPLYVRVHGHAGAIKETHYFINAVAK
jgi:hypothetical protein